MYVIEVKRKFDGYREPFISYLVEFKHPIIRTGKLSDAKRYRAKASANRILEKLNTTKTTSYNVVKAGE